MYLCTGEHHKKEIHHYFVAAEPRTEPTLVAKAGKSGIGRKVSSRFPPAKLTETEVRNAKTCLSRGLSNMPPAMPCGQGDSPACPQGTPASVPLPRRRQYTNVCYLRASSRLPVSLARAIVPASCAS